MSYVTQPTSSDPIMCQMPKKARETARRALSVLESGANQFGTHAGISMAVAISAGRRVDCRKVSQFFPRWERRYRDERRRGHTAKTSAIVGAWELWGGDSARRFALARVRESEGA